MLPKNNSLALKARANIKFDDDLKAFLFAFGGDLPAQKDTIELLNDICVDFIAKTTAEAASFARSQGSNALDLNALLHTQRHDAAKQERLLELDQSFDKIKRLRFLFSDTVSQARKMPTVSESAATGALAPGAAAAAGNLEKKRPRPSNAAPGAGGAPAAPGAAPGAASKKKRVKVDAPNPASASAHVPAAAAQVGVGGGVSIIATSAASRGSASAMALAAAAAAAASTAAPPAAPGPAAASQTEFLL